MLTICGTFFLVSLWNTGFPPSSSEWPATSARKNVHHEEQVANTIQQSLETQHSQYPVDTCNHSGTKTKTIKADNFYLHISEFKLLYWFLKSRILVFHILGILLLISSTSSHSLSKVWRHWDHGKTFNKLSPDWIIQLGSCQVVCCLCM